MTPAAFDLLAPLFHNRATETPPDQPVAVFHCTHEGCDFSTRYRMLEPQRNGARGPLPRRMEGWWSYRVTPPPVVV